FYFAVTPGYFRMLGAPLKQGREFGPTDGSGVVIVNDAMAQGLWPAGSALGPRVKFGGKPWRTVLRIVGNSNGVVIGARANPFAYVQFSAEPGRDLAVAISTGRNPASLAGALRAAVRAVDPDQPIEDIMTMAAMFREQSEPSRFVARLMSGLSVVALALASVGLYGVTAYGVRRRFREIGIRVALGGTGTDMVRLIVGSAWRVIGPGLLFGIGAAWAGTRVLRGVLFGTSPTDPAVFAVTVVLLAAIASLASYLPARRAARVDPLV